MTHTSDFSYISALVRTRFRNTWSWESGYEAGFGKPSIHLSDPSTVIAEHSVLGRYRLVAGTPPEGQEQPAWLFTENETNHARLGGGANESPYVKDAFHEYLVHGWQDAVIPGQACTKVAAHRRLRAPAGGSLEVWLRLSAEKVAVADPLGASFDEVFARRIQEADAFYAGLARPADEAISRQACAPSP